jgi:hypothetical protein
MDRMLNGAEDAISVLLNKLDRLGYTIEPIPDGYGYLVCPKSGTYKNIIVCEYYSSLSDIWEDIKHA